MSSQEPKARRTSHSPDSRVGLRPLTEAEVAEVASWLKGVGGSGTNIEELAITRLSDGALIGMLSYRVDSDMVISIESIVVRPELRARGYGSEAVRLLEDEKINQGLASQFRAEVERECGLCLYFWLRLGYQPRLDGGVLVMARLP